MALLRFIGIANASIWAGTAFFVTFVAGPAMFSQEVLGIFGGTNNSDAARFFAGSVAQVLLSRYFMLQTVCGAVALLLLVFDWLFWGRPIKERTLFIAGGLLVLVLLGAYGFQPKLLQLHQTMYGVSGKVTYVQAQKARQAFRIWHGLSQVLNVVVCGGTFVYLWRVSQPPPSVRFVNRSPPGGNQFRV
jgi:hypothetical protein